MRGKGMANQSVAVTDDGAVHLLMRNGRVAVFGPKGEYRGSRRVSLSYPPDRYSLRASGSRVFLCNFPEDFPWAVDPRRQGTAPGQFSRPSDGLVDAQGRAFIADTGNRRVQVFSPGDTGRPVRVLDVPGAPIALAMRGVSLAVLTDDGQLLAHTVTGADFRLLASGAVGPGARATAIAPDDSLLVAFDGGPDRHRLVRFERDGDGFRDAATLALSYMTEWPCFFPSATPLVRGPQGCIWFPSRDSGHLLCLDPGTDRVEERMSGLYRPTAIAFGPGGRMYVATQGPKVLEFEPGASAVRDGKPFPKGSQLYSNVNVPVWSMLPGDDGSMTVRVVEQGWRKGWPAVTLKRVPADGTAEPFIDFGPLYAKRTRFPPWEGFNALSAARDGNILMAVHPMLAVLKVTPGGQVIWEAGMQPRGGAGEVEFGQLRDLAIDSRGSVWVVDAGRHQVVCLSPAGRLRLRYGMHAGVDDREGKGFDAPSGIAVTRVVDSEYLYVGDAGSQRLVKYQIEYGRE